MGHRKDITQYSFANTLYPAQAIQRDKCNFTRFSTKFRFEYFSECFRGPLKTLWRATCGRRACTWATLLYDI